MIERAAVRNTSDPEQVKGARRAEKDQAEVALNDMKVLLGIPEARRYLWRLMGRCHVFTAIWPSDMSEFREGERNIGISVLDDIQQAEPQAFAKMMLEAKQEQEEELALAEEKRRRKAQRDDTHSDEESEL